MSRAFVKEDSDQRWTPPAPVRELRVVLDGEVVHESDDLQEALNWVAARPAVQEAGFQIRTRAGRLLAEG